MGPAGHTIGNRDRSTRRGGGPSGPPTTTARRATSLNNTAAVAMAISHLRAAKKASNMGHAGGGADTVADRTLAFQSTGASMGGFKSN